LPAEEAQEKAGAKDIVFHVYEYKVLLWKDGKEQQRIKLVRKQTTIGKFHWLFYSPALGHGCYHMTSYKLAAQCPGECCSIRGGSVSFHRDYGKGMGLLFNK
jgi:hypothetical protein